MESALRAVDALGVGIALFQEAELIDDIYTRRSSGYSVVATNALSASQGSGALRWKQSNLFEVEETRTWGPHTISFQLVTGWDRVYIIGVDIPPSDLEALDQVRLAWQQCPKGCKPLLIGD